MKKLILLIALAVTSVMAEDDKVASKPYIGAKLLFQRYEENPIAADAKYRYQTKTIVGTIKNIGRDVMGNPYIVLKGSSEEFEIGGVQCIFSTEDEAEIAELSKGKQVAILGQVKGLILFNVLIDECQFTELPTFTPVKKAVAAK